MDEEWRTRLAEQLLGAAAATELEEERATFAPDGGTAMEIAFGKARSELTYILELGRAHHLPIVGSVVGDEVWIRLGEEELRFRLDRAATAIHATMHGRTSAFAWDPKHRAVATAEGKLVDMEYFVRDAIDATVKAYQSKSTT